MNIKLRNTTITKYKRGNWLKKLHEKYAKRKVPSRFLDIKPLNMIKVNDKILELLGSNTYYINNDRVDEPFSDQNASKNLANSGLVIGSAKIKNKC